MAAKYPELVDIAKDKAKKTLKPVVKFVDDLDSLEEKMKSSFGSDSVHVMLERAEPEEEPEDPDQRFTPHATEAQGDEPGDGEDGGNFAAPEEEPPAPEPPKPQKKAGK